MSVSMNSAKTAWGDTIPAWVLCLAQECDRSSQGKAGRRIGYSSGAICAVLKNKYKGDLAAIENRVRGELMSATVRCPVTGDIQLAVCLDNQMHAKNGNRTSSFRASMVKACRECPISSVGGK